MLSRGEQTCGTLSRKRRGVSIGRLSPGRMSAAAVRGGTLLAAEPASGPGASVSTGLQRPSEDRTVLLAQEQIQKRAVIQLAVGEVTRTWVVVDRLTCIDEWTGTELASTGQVGGLICGR